MKDTRKQYDAGVIIGRFQIHKLHDAHKGLIDEVLKRHKKVLIFLGVSPTLSTRKNPLDFITRKKMLEEAYGDRISVILPIYDKKSDEIWSKEVDTRIKEVFPTDSVVLYGSRDSFIPHYKGRYDTQELVPTQIISATEIRKDVSKNIVKSEEFRAGVIYSVYNTYPTVFSTVDVAIFNEDGSELLLGRKPNESKFRFIGGFVDISDENIEHAVRREAYEETNLEIGDLKYIMTTRVDDWRYRGQNDRSIMTHFYSSKKVMGHAKAKDDIAEIKWFKLHAIDKKNIVPEHIRLLEAIRPES